MKKTFLMASLGLASLCFSQTDYNFVYNNSTIIDNGIALHDKEQYKEAIAAYESIDPLDPKYLAAQYEKALTLSKMEQKVALRAHFEKLYQSGEMAQYPSIFILYGSFLSDEKEYDASEKMFLEGEKLIPNSSNLLYNLAILYLRKEEHQKSADKLKKVITINPNHASAHYFLGLLAFENGKITEGTLAMMSYLVLVPTGRYAEQAIFKLNSKFGQNFLEKGKVVFSASGDNFEEIDEILRNQLPLKDAYKIKSTFDDVVIRQVQAVAEYTLEHKMGNGFFETTYIPWIKKMVAQNQFEGFSYYLLLSMEEKLGKKLTSQKKKITAFYDSYMVKDFWNLYSRRTMDHFGKQETVNIYLEDGYPYLVGPVVNDKKEGKFRLLDADGNLVGELNFLNDEIDGLQKYYDKKGNLELERNLKAGKLNGTKTVYYSNGQISLVEHYKDDVLHGISTNFYVNGGKMCEGNFTDGERDGQFTCLHYNGTKKSVSGYKKGKLNGPDQTYNEAGDLIESASYKDGELTGNYVTYYDGKQIKSEATYANGKISESYKVYNSNNGLEKQHFFENGKLKKIVEYYSNGKISTEGLYDANEELETYTYYDGKGNKYFEEKFKSGELKSGVQFTSKNPKPVTVNLAKKPFVMYTYEGEVYITGNFEKGKKANEWQYNHDNGNLRLKESYSKGQQEGLSYYYNGNGKLNRITRYSNDTIHGMYETYDHGILKGRYHYEKGDQNGPYKIFRPDGTVETEGIFEQDEVVNYRKSYWQDGVLWTKDHFVDGVITSSEIFNPKGVKEHAFDYKNRTGKFSHVLYGTTAVAYEMINGEYHGNYTAKDKLDTPIVTLEYVNGVRHNGYKSYNPDGSLAYERSYYCGKVHGLDKQFDLVGNLRLTNDFQFGDEFKNTVRYYHNKSRMYEYEQSGSTYNGTYTYFNQKGDPILIMGYVNGGLDYYIKNNTSGALTEKIPVTKGTAAITSLYPNGKTAISINFVNNGLDGKLEINNEAGKPEYQAQFKQNLFEGERIEYYANGKIYKKERFVNGDFEGLQEYFKEDGKPWLSCNYKNDNLHGKTLIYKNGVLSITKIYNANELVDIIQ